jgi:hypothetical protein
MLGRCANLGSWGLFGKDATSVFASVAFEADLLRVILRFCAGASIEFLGGRLPRKFQYQ